MKNEKNKKGVSFIEKIGPEALGMILLFLSLYVFVSLVSYEELQTIQSLKLKSKFSNYGGYLGARLSSGLLALLGLAAYLIPIGLAFISLKSFNKGSKKSHKALLENLVWQILILFCICNALGIFFNNITYHSSVMNAGGLLGYALSKQSLYYLNFVGSTLVTLCVVLIAIINLTPLTLKSIFNFTRRCTISFMYQLRLVVSQLVESIRNIKVSKLKKQIAEPESSISKKIINISTVKTELKNEIEVSHEYETLKKTKAEFKKIKAEKLGAYILPDISFLNDPPKIHNETDRNRLLENSKLLETKLKDFGIEGQVVAVRPGPVITMYEVKPGTGVKISQIANLADDLSLALSAQSVRIVAPIPGKSVVGIEIPNDFREKVYLREILTTESFQGSTLDIPLAIGKDISGAPIVADLAKMPHLLIAGAPGAGKSVFINSLICSLLYKFTPQDLRLIMVDPKQLELNLYENIPHLLLPVVDDPKKASTALKWAVQEMERRYKIMARTGVRNIAGFNQKLEKEGTKAIVEALCPEDEKGMPSKTSLSHLVDHDEKGKPTIQKIPFIMVIIDEFADLMMVASKDIETSVARLAQKARAAGIHLVIATQRPSVDVITGLIKANLPSRISFQVASKTDSRTILDGMGAEKLLGMGDLLFIPPGLSRLTRIHGAFLVEDEIVRICDHWRSQGTPVFKEEILIDPDESGDDEMPDGAGDELYQEAISIIRDLGQASASMLQRRLKIGYNRAARMVECMEAQGIVGPADGSKPREVLY